MVFLWFRGAYGFFCSSESSFLRGITLVLWWTWILYIKFIFICVRVISAVYLLCFLNICRIGSVLVHVCKMWGHTSSVRPSDRSQIGLESSESKKCSLRFEIDHFCWGNFSALQSSKNWYESSRGSFRFTHLISVIPMTPSCSLRSFRIWRLVCCELHVDTDFEIYGSTIGVCN